MQQGIFYWSSDRPTFEDEITDNLKHSGAGILSMANRYTVCVQYQVQQATSVLSLPLSPSLLV